MLPIKRRVSKELFPKIMAEGVIGHSDSFYLRLLNKKDNQPSLFGFVVPLKVKKSSVGRHLIKRKMTAAVEGALSSTNPGLAVIIFAKKDVSAQPFIEIRKELLNLLIKTGILNQAEF